MRKLKITTIVFLAGVAVCLGAILVLAVRGKGFGGSGREGGNQGEWNNYRLVMEQEVAASDIRSLEIDYGMTFNDVCFYETEGDTILVREYMNFQPKERQISEVKADGGKLVVKGVKRRHFAFFSFHTWDAYTEIYLPAGFGETLEELRVRTVSGSIGSDIPLTAGKGISVASTSGDILLGEWGAEQLKAGSTSGNIRVESLKGEASVSSTSGDIRLGETHGDLTVSTTSGNITVAGIQGNGAVTSTSGDVMLGEILGDTTVSTTSGSITMGDTAMHGAGSETAGTGGDTAEEGEAAGVQGRRTVSGTEGNAAGIVGDTTVSSSSGDITLGRIQGNMDLSSTSGEIRVREGRGRFDGETTSGDIWLGRLEGDFQVDTTSGALDIMDGSAWGKAETISGDVRIFLEGLTGDLKVSTTSGEVDLKLPEESSFRLDFDSGSGGCSTFFDDILRFNKKGNQAEGTYGGGEHALEVSTTSGDLRIMER